MRLVDIFADLAPLGIDRMLSEHDVVNFRKVDDYIRDLLTFVDVSLLDPRLVRWMTRNLRKIILSNPNWTTGPIRGDERDVAITGVMNDVERQLAKKKIRQREQVHVFTAKDKVDIDQHVQHIIDYFWGLTEGAQVDDPQIRHEVERRINHLSHAKSIREIAEAADEWAAFFQRWKLRNNQTEDALGTETVLELPQGWRWVRVFEANCLNREGVLMQHCVGAYADRVASGNVDIYSLRDPKNDPHVTVEIRKNGNTPEVNQIKGKQNDPPVMRYWNPVAMLFNLLGVRGHQYCPDLEQIGVFRHEGKWGTIDDFGNLIITAPYRVYEMKGPDGRTGIHIYLPDGGKEIAVLHEAPRSNENHKVLGYYSFNSPVDVDQLANAFNVVVPKLAVDFDWEVEAIRNDPPRGIVYFMGRFLSHDQKTDFLRRRVIDVADGDDLHEIARRLGEWEDYFLSAPRAEKGEFYEELSRIFPERRRAGGSRAELIVKSTPRGRITYDGRRFRVEPTGGFR